MIGAFRPYRIPIIIGVIILVIVAYMYVTPAWVFEDGAPTADISVRVMEDNSTTTYSANVPVEPQNMLNEAMATYPLETYTADIPPLNPSAAYIIAFTITVTTEGTAASEGYDTTVTISGGNTRDCIIAESKGPINYTSFSMMEATLSHQTESGEASVFDFYLGGGSFNGAVLSSDTTVYSGILGTMVDGSEFQIEIVSVGAGGSYGMTTATLKIVVGAGGSLSVEIGSIETTVG